MCHWSRLTSSGAAQLSAQPQPQVTDPVVCPCPHLLSGFSRQVLVHGLGGEGGSTLGARAADRTLTERGEIGTVLDADPFDRETAVQRPWCACTGRPSPRGSLHGRSIGVAVASLRLAALAPFGCAKPRHQLAQVRRCWHSGLAPLPQRLPPASVAVPVQPRPRAPAAKKETAQRPLSIRHQRLRDFNGPLVQNPPNLA